MIKLPESSRGMQNIQHFVSGIMQILNYSTAGLAGVTMVGQSPWWLFITVAGITFILNRISSEISYQTSSRLFMEHQK